MHRKLVSYLVGQEVKNIAQCAAVGLVQLSVMAPGAADGGEALGLHIEDLGQKTAGSPHLAALKSGISALWTQITLLHCFSFLKKWAEFSYTTQRTN